MLWCDIIMRRPNAQLQTDRREEILEASRRCFARSGFHGASMQEICAEAGMSPGNLYRYFPSKEAIIAGLIEIDSARAAADFAAVAHAPDFFTGFARLAHQYLVERTPDELALCAEIRAESRRNPEIARIHQTIDAEVRTGLVAVLRAAAERGEISRDLNFEQAVTVLLAIGDGIEVRRVSDPSFDVEAIMPSILDIVKHMLVSPVGTKRPVAELV
jgi:AcrR family transcriptional regulator